MPRSPCRRRGLVGAATCNLAERIDRAQRSREREVQATPDGLRIKAKRKPWRRSAQVRIERLQCRREPNHVVAAAAADDVLRQARGAVNVRRGPTDEDELQATAAKRGEETGVIDARRAFRPARLSSSESLCSSIR